MIGSSRIFGINLQKITSTKAAYEPVSCLPSFTATGSAETTRGLTTEREMLFISFNFREVTIAFEVSALSVRRFMNNRDDAL